MGGWVRAGISSPRWHVYQIFFGEPLSVLPQRDIAQLLHVVSFQKLVLLSSTLAGNAVTQPQPWPGKQEGSLTTFLFL